MLGVSSRTTTTAPVRIQVTPIDSATLSRWLASTRFTGNPSESAFLARISANTGVSSR